MATAASTKPVLRLIYGSCATRNQNFLLRARSRIPQKWFLTTSTAIGLAFLSPQALPSQWCRADSRGNIVGCYASAAACEQVVRNTSGGCVLSGPPPQAAVPNSISSPPSVFPAPSNETFDYFAKAYVFGQILGDIFGAVDKLKQSFSNAQDKKAVRQDTRVEPMPAPTTTDMQASPANSSDTSLSTKVVQLALSDGQIYQGTEPNEQGRHHGTISFSEGAIERYYGDFLNGDLDGSGTIEYRSGAKYIGQLADSNPHGFGTFTAPDDHSYVGQWSRGYPNGSGTLSYRGWRYQGQFLAGKVHGRGTQIDPSGVVYDGEFYDGARNGQGTAVHPDGIRFVGEWNAGKPNGTGTIQGSDGSVLFTGEWVDGVRSGQGTSTSDGITITGTWKSNLFDGPVDITFPDGSSYSGESKAGKLVGEGTRTYPDGASYRGQWLDGRHHGFGRLQESSGRIYEGHWQEGIRTGQGRLKYTDGGLYVGEFTSGLPHGSGSLTTPEGDQYVGDFVRGKKQGHGTEVNARTKQTYTGAWKANRWHGLGVLSSSAGLLVRSGMWCSGNPVDAPSCDKVTSDSLFSTNPIEVKLPTIASKPSELSQLLNSCYPISARRLEETGRVVVLIEVDKNGQLLNHTISASSGHYSLDQATACVLRGIEFNPGSRDGVPEMSNASLPITFSLSE